MKWVILTGEYPPQPGGVADYTRLVARALAGLGDDVHVWTAGPGPAAVDRGVTVHHLEKGYGRDGRATLDAALARMGTDCQLLVQYVPTAFGWRGMNVPFCLWLRRHREIPSAVMFHEVAFPWGVRQSIACNVRGVVTRMMARILASAADRLFVSIPAWAPLLGSTPGHGEVTWLPVPATVPAAVNRDAAKAVRAALGAAGAVIGHFSTYGDPTRAVLRAAIPPLLHSGEVRTALLLGRGGAEFRQELIRIDPSLEGRVVAPGFLEDEPLAAYLSACDVLLQPYPDGVSCRRTTAMAALALGVPLVTSHGPLTESIWKASGAAILVDVRAAQSEFVTAVEALVNDPRLAAALGARGRGLYASHFGLERTIRALRTGADRVAA